jgi:hypothetical protein
MKVSKETLETLDSMPLEADYPDPLDYALALYNWANVGNLTCTVER